MGKRINIFKFKKNEAIDLTNTPEVDCNAIECGKDRFTLKEFKVQVGHDDSLPYTAILCVNGKSICRCLNDGWGGQTEMTPLDAQSRALMASVQVKIAKYKWSFHGTEFVLDLDFIADTLAISMSHGA